VYVSCGIESFLDDAARLTSGGKLRLRGLTAFNLMPFTEHVETVACFERSAFDGDRIARLQGQRLPISGGWS
jgi:hypothetical protein